MAIDETGVGTTFSPVASVQAWTLDMKRDLVDVTAFQDTVKQYVQGLPDLKGTFTAVWDPTTTPSDIFKIAMGDVAVYLRLTPSTLTATNFFKGLAYLDASINVPANGAIIVSGNFAAAGDWSLEPPPA